MTARDPIGFDAPPFTLPKDKTGPRGCDDLTPVLLGVIVGAVAAVVTMALAGALP